ncbi:MAG: phosphate ABC transporter permease PtsA [Candidatus Coatesbacteria bacterium]|nr:MAG: phosphate ABC transporter permease PtsA [Candidatus Coatesbacteria bacterium]
MRRFKQIFGFALSTISLIIALSFLILIITYIIIKGYSVLSWEFISQPPKMSMTKGGILPAIVGTALLSIGAILFSLPFGVLSSIYLNEYARGERIKRIIRVGVNSLAGVPSVVFGLFGLAIFVKYFNFGVSVLSGSLTLGILILPIIIRATEEALKMVPNSFREASLAMGATRWQTTIKVVLPSALPNILTGVILSIGRAAGETAPILFTAAAFYLIGLPNSIFDKVMALPYHIYALMTEGTFPKEQTTIAYGTAFVLLVLVLGMNIIAIMIRIRSRRKQQW